MSLTSSLLEELPDVTASDPELLRNSSNKGSANRCDERNDIDGVQEQRCGKDGICRSVRQGLHSGTRFKAPR